MTKVYPNGSVKTNLDSSLVDYAADKDVASVFTIWKKSLLFNCNGYTAFNRSGEIVFRVDNYMAGNKDEILLMDASGHPLLTTRRKWLSLADKWMVYGGESTKKPLYQVRKNVSIFNNKEVAYVREPSTANVLLYKVEGSYAKRCCYVENDKGKKIAEIKLKDRVEGVTFGSDVFSLVVQSDLDCSVAMTLVILFDQMFKS